MPLIRKGPNDKPAADFGAPVNNASLLLGGDRDQRWAAARALAGQAEGGKALAAALPNEPDPRVREAILTGLIRHPGDASVVAILPLIRSDDASVRTGALDSLRAMPEALAARLSEVLADPDPDVRLLVCDLVRVLPSNEASRTLCALLDQETEPNVCAAALDALAEVGGPEARPSLERCAARFADEPFLRFAVRAALDRIGAPSPEQRG
jgi:HEAT repeat protein